MLESGREILDVASTRQKSLSAIISGVFASPWPFEAVEAFAVEEKCVLIEEFGRQLFESSAANPS